MWLALLASHVALLLSCGLSLLPPRVALSAAAVRGTRCCYRVWPSLLSYVVRSATTACGCRCCRGWLALLAPCGTPAATAARGLRCCRSAWPPLLPPREAVADGVPCGCCYWRCAWLSLLLPPIVRGTHCSCCECVACAAAAVCGSRWGCCAWLSSPPSWEPLQPPPCVAAAAAAVRGSRCRRRAGLLLQLPRVAVAAAAMQGGRCCRRVWLPPLPL
jgi:hypothetical protein